MLIHSFGKIYIVFHIASSPTAILYSTESGKMQTVPEICFFQFKDASDLRDEDNDLTYFLDPKTCLDAKAEEDPEWKLIGVCDSTTCEDF